MSNRNRLPRHKRWTGELTELGGLFGILWFVGLALSCWTMQPVQLSLPPLLGLALPFFIPVLPALAITLWLRIRFRDYPTIWAGLADSLRQAWHLVTEDADVAPAGESSSLVLGRGEDGRPYQLDDAGLHLHLLVDGKTRQGKSTLLSSIAWQDVARNDCAVVVLDPHSALVDRLLAAGLAYGADDRTVGLLTDEDAVPGFNLLQPLPGESADECAARFVECAMALWFQGDVTEAQRFQNYTYHAGWALAATGWTVLEIEPLLRHRPFRQRIADQVSDPRLRAWLAELDRERDQRIRDLTESTVNRFRSFTRGENAFIFGQRQTTFDLPTLLDEGGILLAALPASVLGDTGSYLAAGVLLSLTDTCLAGRRKDSPHHTNPRVRLVADESQAYAVPPLRRLLAERAGFGASLVLATQGLNQLTDHRLARFVLNNVGVRAVFACGADEAADMAEELFRPDPLLVKREREPWVTFYTPQEQMTHRTKAIQNLPPHTFFADVPGREPVRCTTRQLPVRLDDQELAQARTALARRAGRPRAEVEEELAQRKQRIYGGGTAGLDEEDEDGWF